VTARPEAEQPVEVCDVCPFGDLDKPGARFVDLPDGSLVDVQECLVIAPTRHSSWRVMPRHALILAILASGKRLSAERILIATGSEAQQKSVYVHVSLINRFLAQHCPEIRIGNLYGEGFRLALVQK